MKILQIADVPSWAIGHLTQLVAKHNPQLHFKQQYWHPKEVERLLMDSRKKDELLNAIAWADIVDLQYWRTASQLLEFVPELHTKKLILTHHNQKDLLAYDWKVINHHVVHTAHAEAVLRSAGYENITIVPYGFDLSFFRYRENDPEVPTVGYCGRVVPWKGLKEIAQACYELGYPILAMGKVDKPSYWESIPKEHRDNIDFSYMNAPDDMRADFYNDITIYVGNSGPNHEEGTMPLQEAMACGVPVVSTPSGVAMDMLDDGRNGLVVNFGDYEGLKNSIRVLMENKDLRDAIRAAAWQTIKLNTEERMAWEFAKVFHQVYRPEHPLISVVVPTYNSKDTILQILGSMEQSSWPHTEVVICDDGSTDGTVEMVAVWREKHPDVIVKMVSVPAPASSQKRYGLAEARNRGVIEAMGEYIMFCDSRLCPDPDAITRFYERHKLVAPKNEKKWLFGDKGSLKRSFVENFSFIRRDFFIRAGMMNERIDHYGGMSQELRARFQWQGFEPIFVEEAKAVQLKKSGLTDARRQDIITSKLQLWKMGLKG